MKKLVIAIDGYVASGKSTTAKLLAKKLGYKYLDTGAMYRAVALYARRKGLLDVDDEKKIAMMKDITLDFVYNPETKHYEITLNGENVEKEIRTTQVSLDTMAITRIPEIRSILIQQQRAYASEGGIVAEGRDMGTVVFPDADVKFFFIADLQTRVERRYQQLIQKGLPADKQTILTEIQARDQSDYLGINPINTIAPDAIIIDTSNYTTEEQVQKVLDIIYQIQTEKNK